MASLDDVCAREVERDLTNICVVFKGLCEEQELAGDCGCVDRGEGVRYANYENSRWSTFQNFNAIGH